MIKYISLILVSVVIMGCSQKQEPVKTMPYVDINRFMGDWYVIANIPTFIEKNAYNALEQYELNDDGTIATTFTYRNGSFDGEKKTYTPKGFIQDDKSNAIWGMQFIWPIKSDFRIVYVDSDYSKTIIGRNARDYVWVMARTPSIPEKDFEEMKSMVEKQGYDISKMKMVPQKW